MKMAEAEVPVETGAILRVSLWPHLVRAGETAENA
jgi:hypothetical protein